VTTDASSEPLTIDTADGQVVVTGPRVAVALTPQAAAETAKRLGKAAEEASKMAVDPPGSPPSNYDA
jgi:hypothetical protein